MNAAPPITKKTSPLRTKKRIVLFGITAALMAAIAAPGGDRDTARSGERQAAGAGGFDMPWFTVDGGGGTSEGGGFVLTGTAGQPDAGDLIGGGFTLRGGFWQPAAAGDPGCGDCPTDVDGSGATGASDLAVLLGSWGPCDPGDACECLDSDGNGIIGAADLAVLLGSWGPCP